jgi:hypothetical protein
LCEAFPGRFPTEVLAERDRLPEGFLEDLLEARAYERAFWIYRANPKATGEMVQQVQRIEFELVQADLTDAEHVHD